MMPTKLRVSERVCALSFLSTDVALRSEHSVVATSTLLAVATRSALLIVEVVVHADDNVATHILKEVTHKERPACVCWSSRTVSSGSSAKFVLATAGLGALRLFTLYNSEQSEKQDGVRVLRTHKDYVNDVAFDEESGEILAAASDDHTVSLHHGPSGKTLTIFEFRSPVMAVRFHGLEPSKMMAAEKNGMVHIYNVVTYNPIVSFDCGTAPLMSADWSIKNSLSVCALVGPNLVVWDTSRSSRAVQKCDDLHSQMGRWARYSRHDENLVATIGQPSSSVKVTNLKTGQVQTCSSDQPVGGLSWHPSLPLLAVGQDMSVSFQKLFI